MAAVIVVILFPEMRATFSEQFTALGWGTGLGSAVSGLGLIVASFLLRPALFLRSPGGGDRFMNRIPFPLRRNDDTLFTWPLMGSAAFLIIRTGSVTLVQNLADGPGLRFAVSVLLTACAWMLAGIYLRRLRSASFATYVGCGYLVLAVALMFLVQAPDIDENWALLTALTALQLIYLAGWFTARAGSGKSSDPLAANESDATTTYLGRVLGADTDRTWIRGVVSTPVRNVLHAATLVLTGVCAWQLVGSSPSVILLVLVGFLCGQLCWHGLSASSPAYGVLLFLLAWLAIVSNAAIGSRHLFDRIKYQSLIPPTLVLLLAVQVAVTSLEFIPGLYRRLRNCCSDAVDRHMSDLRSDALVRCRGDCRCDARCSGRHHSTLAPDRDLCSGLVTARVQASVAILSGVLLLSYFLFHTDVYGIMGDSTATAIEQRMRAFASPWRLSALALILAVTQALLSRLTRAWRRLIRGRFAQRPFASRDAGWLVAPSLLAGLAATVVHSAEPVFREQRLQMIAPFTAAVAWGVLGWSSGRTRLYIGSGMLIAIGNIHVVRIFLGEHLRPYGVSEIQLVCFGLAASLLELTTVRLIARNDVITRSFNRASLGLAGLVMALTGINYVAHPDLSTITWQRFAMSGGMAWLAGLYFRRAARRPMSGEEPFVRIAEGMHHLGLTVALWCAVLMIPVMRSPEFALMSLGIPLLWFWLRAEAISGLVPAPRDAYRDSAACAEFCFAVCVCVPFCLSDGHVSCGCHSRCNHTASPIPAHRVLPFQRAVCRVGVHHSVATERPGSNLVDRALRRVRTRCRVVFHADVVARAESV